MIEAYTGLPGMGKTYHMTKDALAVIERGKRLERKGKPFKRVFANYRLEGAEYFKELNELKNEKNILVLIDEAGIYLPSQAWKNIPFEFVRQMRQSRHDGIDLWYTAQDFKDVATYLRRITQFEHRCNRVWKAFTVKTLSPHTKEKYGTSFSFLSEEVFSKYDTTENINFSAHIALK